MVGLGDTKQKLQNMIDMAEKLYTKMNEVRNDIEELRTRVENTSDQVDGMSHQVAEQRAILEALADEQGVDVEQVIADADIEDRAAGSDDPAPRTEAAADVSADSTND